MHKPYFVYVLWSETGQRYYIGVTENIETRLAQHNAGASKWTKRFAGSWQLVWSEQCADLSAARRLENTLKRQKGGNGFFTITGLQSGSSSGS